MSPARVGSRRAGREPSCARHRSRLRTARDALPAGSDVRVVENAGHFLQLEQPETVGRLIVDFLGTD